MDVLSIRRWVGFLRLLAIPAMGISSAMRPPHSVERLVAGLTPNLQTVTEVCAVVIWTVLIPLSGVLLIWHPKPRRLISAAILILPFIALFTAGEPTIPTPAITMADWIAITTALATMLGAVVEISIPSHNKSIHGKGNLAH